MDEADFIGAKIAVLRGGAVLTLQRDDLPGLPWAGMWDLPGGGREGGEPPLACALRELREELSLDLPPGLVVWRRGYRSVTDPARRAWFFVAEASGAALAGIRLGDEGQDWRWMGIAEFLGRADAVPHFKARLGDYLENGTEQGTARHGG